MGRYVCKISFYNSQKNKYIYFLSLILFFSNSFAGSVSFTSLASGFWSCGYPMIAECPISVNSNSISLWGQTHNVSYPFKVISVAGSWSATISGYSCTCSSSGTRSESGSFAGSFSYSPSDCGSGSGSQTSTCTVFYVPADDDDSFCSADSSTAATLFESAKRECVSDSGAVFTGGVNRFGKDFCVSAECNDCYTEKWNNDILEYRTNECCQVGSEPSTDFSGSCTIPTSNGIGVTYSDANPFRYGGCAGLAGTGDNHCNVDYCAIHPDDLENCVCPDNPDADGCPHNCITNPEHPSCPSSSSSSEGSSSSEPEYSSSYEPKSSSSSSEIASSSSNKVESSSSNDYEYSSSSSDSETGGGNVCASSKPFLQKPVSFYDDWVYIGKEAYGSRQVSGPAKFSTKFFDVLGRAYDKMKANIKYYVLKEAIENKRNVALEFEVYMRVIKDSDGNDVRVFVKEDKKNGFRRDSSFYWNGSWEVMETNDVARIVKFKNSSGIKATSKYDVTWHINKFYATDKNDDTLALEQYVWRNDRLIKTIFNGVERIFIYGKTLQDTVKVIPPDNRIAFHSGYNNTIGRIPDKNDSEYEYFARNPYSIYGIKRKTPMLFKYNNVNISFDDIHEPTYYPPFKVTRNLDTNRVYPDSINGETRFGLYWGSKCQDDGCGQFYVNDSVSIAYESIILQQSFLVYKSPKWRRYCRTQGQINASFRHEVQHIDNARNKIKILNRKYIPMLMQKFSTKEACNSALRRGENLFSSEWLYWSYMEFNHANSESPRPTGFRLGDICNDDMD